MYTNTCLGGGNTAGGSSHNRSLFWGSVQQEHLKLFKRRQNPDLVTVFKGEGKVFPWQQNPWSVPTVRLRLHQPSLEMWWKCADPRRFSSTYNAPHFKSDFSLACSFFVRLPFKCQFQWIVMSIVVVVAVVARWWACVDSDCCADVSRVAAWLELVFSPRAACVWHHVHITSLPMMNFCFCFRALAHRVA